MIYCPKWKIRNGKSFWKFFLPNWSWARQPLSSARSTLLYPFQMLSAKQGSSNSHPSFGMTRPGIEPTTSRLCRKYSLKNHAMGRPSGIMQSQVSINPNSNLQMGTLTPIPRLGRPRQSTLEDGRQLLRWVRNGRTKSTSAPRRRMAAAHKRTLIPTADQQPVGSSRTLWMVSLEETSAGRKLTPSIAGMGAQQVATRTLQSCGLKRSVKVYREDGLVRVHRQVPET